MLPQDCGLLAIQTLASAAQIPVTTTMETDAAQQVCCRGPSSLEHMSIAKAFVCVHVSALLSAWGMSGESLPGKMLQTELGSKQTILCSS